MREHTLFKMLYISCVLMVTIYVIFGTITNTGLYADGSGALVEILKSGNNFYIDPVRDYTALTRGLFTVVALKLGVTSIPMLAKLFSLGYALTAAVPWLIALAFCRYKKKIDLLIYTIILTCVSLGLCFHMQMESMCGAGIFWCLYLYFWSYSVSDDEKIPLYFRAIFMMFAIMQTRTHESIIFLSILLLIVIFYRVFKEKLKIDLLLLCHIVLLIAAFILAAKGLINLRDPNNASGAYGAVFAPDLIFLIIYILLALCFITGYFADNNLPHNRLFLIAGIVSALLFISFNKVSYFFGDFINIGNILKPLLIVLSGIAMDFIYNKFIHNKKLIITVVSLLQLFTGIIFIYLAVSRTDFIAVQGYYNRVMNILAIFGFACLLTFVLMIKASYPKALFKYLAIFLMIGTSYLFIVPRIHYSDYLKALNKAAEQSETTGFVTLSKALSKTNINTLYCVLWTLPSENILSQALYGGRGEIDNIVVGSKKDIWWEPYDSHNIDEYPDLTRYGVYYGFENEKIFKIDALDEHNRVFVADSNNDIYYDRGDFYWLKENVALPIYLKSNTPYQINFNVPDILFAANPDKIINLKIMINDTIIKEIPFDKDGDYDIILTAEELSLIQDDEYTLKLITNASFKPSEHLDSTDGRDLSIMLKYFGQKS